MPDEATSPGPDAADVPDAASDPATEPLDEPTLTDALEELLAEEGFHEEADSESSGSTTSSVSSSSEESLASTEKTVEGEATPVLSAATPQGGDHQASVKRPLPEHASFLDAALALTNIVAPPPRAQMLQKTKRQRTLARARSFETASDDADQDAQPRDTDALLEWTLSRFNKKTDKRAVRALVAAVRDRSLPRPLVVASACSGTDIWADCVETLCDDLGEQSLSAAPTRIAFACDIDATVQRYLRLKEQVVRDDACIFDNALDLASLKAKCVKHGLPGGCTVPGSHTFGFGSSCKDLSSENPNCSASKGNPLSGNGTSSTTFLGSMSYVRVHRPALVMMENVTGMDDTGDDDSQLSNLQIAMNCFEAIGYLTFRATVSAHNYFLPQTRHRMYVLALSKDSEVFQVAPALPLRESLSRHLKQLASKVMLPLEFFLLPNDDEAVQAELQRLIQDKANGEKTANNDVGWPAKHTDFFETNGLRRGALQPTRDIGKSPWWPTLLDREQECLMVEALDPKLVSCDVGQSIGRTRATKLTDSGDMMVGAVSKLFSEMSLDKSSDSDPDMSSLKKKFCSKSK